MTFETFKWIYQRISTPLILILSIFVFYKAFQIQSYDYNFLNIFFKDKYNLVFFLLFIFLLIFHTSIEVFHSLDDYFAESKNENLIKYSICFLYIIVFISILFFVIQFV